jgi:hypothetical protein
MKTKPTLNPFGTKTASYMPGGMLSFLVTILCVLLILAVGRHLAMNHSTLGMGMGMGEAPIMYPPRQMPMMFAGGEGNGMGGALYGGNGMAWPPDVLRNPYAAPMKDDRYLVGPPMFPINVSTNPGAVDTSYRQVGTLSPDWGRGGECRKCKLGKCDGNCRGGNTPDGDLLILMGRPLFTNRDMWQYYAISNQRNGVKLPVRVGGKNATNEYGVRELNGGEVITVDGYNKRYQVGLYESDTIKYLPSF